MTDRPRHPAEGLEFSKDCPVCHGKGWYKEEAAPVTRECNCQDYITDTGKKVNVALNTIYAALNGDALLKDGFRAVKTIRSALTSHREPINQKLLDALKDLLDSAKSCGYPHEAIKRAEQAISRAEAQKGDKNGNAG